MAEWVRENFGSDKVAMKSLTICCCILLLFASIGNFAVAAISDEGKQAIESLRLKQSGAELEPAKPGLRELTDHLRKKHEQNALTETATPETAAVPVDEPVTSGANAEKDIAEANEQIAANQPTSETITYDTCSDSKIMAEKYDHVPDTPKTPVSPNTSQASSQNKSGDGAFAGLLATCLFLGFGYIMLAVDNRKNPGIASNIGCVLMLIGTVFAFIAIKNSWPLPLLLLFGAMFGQKGASSNGGCGCGCFIMLLILAMILS